eukprot:Clim_evm160s157 gene=Clim_evmTU160s157
MDVISPNGPRLPSALRRNPSDTDNEDGSTSPPSIAHDLEYLQVPLAGLKARSLPDLSIANRTKDSPKEGNRFSDVLNSKRSVRDLSHEASWASLTGNCIGDLHPELSLVYGHIVFLIEAGFPQYVWMAMNGKEWTFDDFVQDHPQVPDRDLQEVRRSLGYLWERRVNNPTEMERIEHIMISTERWPLQEPLILSPNWEYSTDGGTSIYIRVNSTLSTPYSSSFFHLERRVSGLDTPLKQKAIRNLTMKEFALGRTLSCLTMVAMFAKYGIQVDVKKRRFTVSQKGTIPIACKSLKEMLNTNLPDVTDVQTEEQAVAYGLQFPPIADIGPFPPGITSRLKFVAENASAEGLYRVKGTLDGTVKVKQSLEEIDGSDDDDPVMVHDVASALKSYVRHMKRPLISRQLSPLYRAAMNLPDIYSKLQMMQRLNFMIPEESRDALEILMCHLHHVAETPNNRMDTYNLAVCWSPLLLANMPHHTEVSRSSTSGRRKKITESFRTRMKRTKESLRDLIGDSNADVPITPRMSDGDHEAIAKTVTANVEVIKFLIDHAHEAFMTPEDFLSAPNMLSLKINEHETDVKTKLNLNTAGPTQLNAVINNATETFEREIMTKDRKHSYNWHPYTQYGVRVGVDVSPNKSKKAGRWPTGISVVRFRGKTLSEMKKIIALPREDWDRNVIHEFSEELCPGIKYYEIVMKSHNAAPDQLPVRMAMIRSWKTLSDGSYLLVCRGVLHPRVPSQYDRPHRLVNLGEMTFHLTETQATEDMPSYTTVIARSTADLLGRGKDWYMRCGSGIDAAFMVPLARHFICGE